MAFEPGDFVVRQVFYPSRDGTRVPMFIAQKAWLKPDGNAPTLLYGYGGFNISLTPRFSGKPTLMSIREYADMWAFLAEILGMDL